MTVTADQCNDQITRAAWQLRRGFRFMDAWDLHFGHLADDQLDPDARRERLGIADLVAEAVTQLIAAEIALDGEQP